MSETTVNKNNKKSDLTVLKVEMSSETLCQGIVDVHSVIGMVAIIFRENLLYFSVDENFAVNCFVIFGLQEDVLKPFNLCLTSALTLVPGDECISLPTNKGAPETFIKRSADTSLQFRNIKSIIQENIHICRKTDLLKRIKTKIRLKHGHHGSHKKGCSPIIDEKNCDKSLEQKNVSIKKMNAYMLRNNQYNQPHIPKRQLEEEKAEILTNFSPRPILPGGLLLPSGSVPRDVHHQSVGEFATNNVASFQSAQALGEKQRNRKPPRYPEQFSHEKRLISYNSWPHVSPAPLTLAKAGFFYTGTGDLVRCHQCGIGLKDFSPEDDPLTEHIKHADNCDYLIDMYGVAGLEEKRCHINDPEHIRRRQLASFQAQKAPDTTFRRPEYASYEARLATFDGWPEEASQRPHQLAGAGLYFAGVGDHVRCFACDGGLRQWDAGDDPWVEHCRWFPACPFARTTKGDQFIALIQASVDQGEDFSGLEDTSPASQYQDESPMDIVTSGIDNIALGRAELEKHRRTCTDELGFSTEEFEEALLQLRTSGNILPTLEDLIICIGDIQKRAEIRQFQQETVTVDTPESILEENARLKHIFKCSKCNVNDINALFLPCAHHRMCMDCASKYDVTVCPVCDRPIREIIKTYMG
ncbi:putative inhibitor of apoptosis [Mya arenaria]|uniref:putative inhibitor of apoptosis n=1 Tax=Mya arenaria TaxID=6604 RepID=UPI0022E39345|nr:putative inhibitor of apoptosis [Mya arenaria]